MPRESGASSILSGSQLRETGRPNWGLLLNQPNFPGSIPLLEPLFTTDRAFDIAELFEVNQAMDAVSFGEAAHYLRSMLEYPPNKIVCDPDIERATNLTGEDVHPENFLFAHR